MNPLISVIVPTYNVEKYLNKCVTSLINQTYVNLEIILVNDGSTDNSGSMCDDFAKNDSRIRVIHKKNQGLGMARNTGIENATGDYICFIDSDDYVSALYYFISGLFSGFFMLVMGMVWIIPPLVFYGILSFIKNDIFERNERSWDCRIAA